MSNSLLAASQASAKALFDSFGADLALALSRNVQAALEEDVGPGDPTALLADEGAWRVARVICRERAILCGRPWFDAVMKAVDPRIKTSWLVEEGAWTIPQEAVCMVEGPARSMLTAERSGLNFIQTLSGTATRARKFADLAEGSQAKALDTRKTIPGLRLAQKYATRVGGGFNQRLALYDGILIKENHIASCGGVERALERAKALGAGVPIQIEVENLGQLRQALDAGAESVLLDNFSLESLREAVELNARQGRRALLEASGGVDETTFAGVAATGVDRVSVGSITKRVDPVDFSWRVELD
jgi:nicotinate-nucleotide pyrophosphorylase (carboxylating)